MPELNRKQLYEDFTRVLWHAYKDLMQKAAKIMEPEWGSYFKRMLSSRLGSWNGARGDRNLRTLWRRGCASSAEWQNEMAAFRNNVLEHKDETDHAAYAGRYEPAHAEQLFDRVWRTIADILAMLVSLHMPPRTKLVEIPEEERDKFRPRRFRFFVSRPNRSSET